MLLAGTLAACGGTNDAPPPAPDAATARPQLVAPGIVSTTLPEFGAALTPDGRELYFNRASVDRTELAIYQSLRTDNGWSEPVVVSFSGQYRDLDPFVEPNGARLYFSSDRPSGGTSGGFDLWFVRREGDGWARPTPLPPPISTEDDEIFVTATRDGELFYARYGTSGPALFHAVPSGDGYEEHSLPESINRFTPSNPAIDPTGAVLVLVITPPGEETSDLYVSRRRAEVWSEPIRLPEPINGPFSDFAPSWSADGQILFFTSERPGVSGAVASDARPPGDLYQIDASVVVASTTP